MKHIRPFDFNMDGRNEDKASDEDLEKQMQETNLPSLTPEQRAEALAKAAAARHARAALRDDIKAGKISLAEVFEMEDDVARRMKVSALIEALPGYGKAKAAKIMEELGISESRRVQGLGVRQREQLLAKLGNN